MTDAFYPKWQENKCLHFYNKCSGPTRHKTVFSIYCGFSTTLFAYIYAFCYISHLSDLNKDKKYVSELTSQQRHDCPLCFVVRYNLYFFICLSRWHWRSDGSLHRSQHPHYSRTLWLSIWGKISFFKIPLIFIRSLSLRQCNLLFMEICTAPVLWNYLVTKLSFSHVTIRTRTCSSERDERSVPHNPALFVTHTHTHISAAATLNTLTFWMYYILD